ncbi:MAG: PadR family transcriptional regulator [bacterium]|nr:PadR family transcriptional regulator [bacterium]
MRITTLDFAILGLLLSGDKTAYAIRMIFKNTAMGNYSSSPGSIYPSCNKLQKLELIAKNIDTGLLNVTSDGKKRIKEWLTEPITIEQVSKGTNVLLLKFAFMDHLVSKEEKLIFLNSFLALSKVYLQSLEKYHQSDEGALLPLHGRLSFEFGLATLKTHISWLKSTLKIIEKEP